MGHRTSVRKSGFTIVELLVVVVVIAILASITVVAFRGVQQRARDTQRKQDIRIITKALEMYYLDNGEFPMAGCVSGCKINTFWSSTSDGSWTALEAALVPKYISKLPTDPQASTATNPAILNGYNYDYTRAGGWCSAGIGQLYMLAYKLEGEPQKNAINGDCPGTQPTDYVASEYVQRK